MCTSRGERGLLYASTGFSIIITGAVAGVGNTNTMRVARVGVSLLDVDSGKTAAEIAEAVRLGVTINIDRNWLDLGKGSVFWVTLPAQLGPDAATTP